MTTGDEAAGTTVPDALGWLLALRAMQRLDAPTHVRLTGHVASPGGWDLPTRRRVATAAGAGAVAIVDGVRADERLAERRWLAWFPRPVGPRHAVNVGGPGVDRLADEPGLRLVRAHLTMSSWQAEALQAAANLAGTRTGRRVLERWVERGRRLDDAEVRWACVVEVTADEQELVRAWAHGWAPTATGVVLDDLLAASTSGVDRAVCAADARTVLDELASATGMRWSLTGPDPR